VVVKDGDAEADAEGAEVSVPDWDGVVLLVAVALAVTVEVAAVLENADGVGVDDPVRLGVQVDVVDGVSDAVGDLVCVVIIEEEREAVIEGDVVWVADTVADLESDGVSEGIAVADPESDDISEGGAVANAEGDCVSEGGAVADPEGDSVSEGGAVADADPESGTGNLLGLGAGGAWPAFGKWSPKLNAHSTTQRMLYAIFIN